MKKNILNLYEGFFDDLDQLNQDDGFGDVNRGIYDEHDIILSPDKNPEFFEGLLVMCGEDKSYKKFTANKNGFTQEDLDKIIHIDSTLLGFSYFQFVTSLDELQYFHNLEEIHYDCFNKCEEIKSVIFPENLKIINNGAFADCISLEKLYLPKNLIKIENLSFEKCSSLKEIIIPKKFKNRMNSIFYGIDLTKVNITYI